MYRYEIIVIDIHIHIIDTYRVQNMQSVRVSRDILAHTIQSVRIFAVHTIQPVRIFQYKIFSQ
jgi:hypothetical protein